MEELFVNDQAKTLRELRKTMPLQQVLSGQTRVMSITSGKGGVGKTHTVINLAIALSDLGRRVLVLDGDMSLANADVLLGINTPYTLRHVLEGEKSLSEIIVDTPFGVSLIPGASGVESLLDLTAQELEVLKNEIEEVAADYDYLIIDTPAGIGQEVMYFNAASGEVICIINNEPTSLTDAYALLKLLSKRHGEKEVSVLVNNTSSDKEAQHAFQRLSAVASQYLHIHLKFLGSIPADSSVLAAIQDRRPVISEFPTSKASRALSQVAVNIDEDFYKYRVKGGMQFFFQQLITEGAYGG